MSDDGDTKDDVKMPEGEIGEKITKLFKVDEKDTSKPSPVNLSSIITMPSGQSLTPFRRRYSHRHGGRGRHRG